MAAKHQPHAPMQTPELSMSDSENAYSSDEEEMLLTRDELDRWLGNALRYIIVEGGTHSRTKYKQHIHEINQNLQGISKYGDDCDRKLYRSLKQRVDHVLREFEDMGIDSSVEDDEVSDSDVVGEEPPDFSPVTPTATSALGLFERSGKDKRDEERTYLYGGPKNHPEIWWRGAPASLPFPETIRMAHWESLRVDWDLAATGNAKNSEPVTSNGVPFHDPRLTHHDSLSRYETGSRFRLPAVNSTDMAKVADYATVDRLRKAVDVFNRHNDAKSDSGDFEYAPRVALDRLEVGSQITHATLIDDVREAVNASPTRRRPDIGSNRKGGSASPVSPSLHDETEESGSDDPANLGNEYVDVRIANVPSVSDPKQTSKPTPNTPTRETAHGVSPAIRRIKAATESSIRGRSASANTVGGQVATHVSIPATGSSGRPRKSSLPASPLSNTFTAAPKRKRSTEDPVEEAVQPKSKTAIAPAKRRSTESAQPSTPPLSSGLHTPSPTPAKTPALTTSGSSVASTPRSTKAKTKAAGKKTRKIRTKHDYEERVTLERYREIMRGRTNVTAQGHEKVPRGVTRSGLIRKK